ncbi:MAG: hypothetical protein ACMXYD_03695 [Candidatus Woesearchaeota archaeon]
MDKHLLNPKYSCINKQGIRVLKPCWESAYILSRNYSDYRSFSEKHKKILSEQFSKETLSCLKNIGYTFKSSKDYNTVRKTMKRKIKILKSIKGLYYGSIQRFFAIKNKKRELVVFYGPDGTGKTTLTSNFKLFLNEELDLNFELKHFFSREKIKRFINPKKMNEMNKSYLKSLIKNLLSYFERQLFFRLSIKLRMLSGKSFIFDRFFLDFPSKIKRYGKHYSYFFEKLCIFFSPKPDIVFFLKGNPNLIHKRKSELTPTEIKQSYDFYEYLFNKYPEHIKNGYTINIDHNLDKVNKDIEIKYLLHSSKTLL